MPPRDFNTPPISSPIDNITRRRLLTALPTLGLLAAGVGCGDDDDDTQATPTENTGPGFPITIEHQHGSTTIESAPERVVSFGYNEQDFLLALGVKPVALRPWSIDDPYPTGQWAQEALGDEPALLEESDLELIASLNPDLIVAIYYEMKAEEYELLRQIAPTIPRPANYIDYGVPWEEELTIIGKALGKDDEATRLISGVDQKFADVRAAHPEWEGLTFAMAFDRQDGNMGLNSPGDTRSQVIRNFGFVMSEDVLPFVETTFSASVSWERAKILETDVLFWRMTAAEMEGHEIFQNLEVVRSGRIVYLDDDPETVAAMSYNSPLSLPFAIDRLVPQIEAAVANL